MDAVALLMRTDMLARLGPDLSHVKATAIDELAKDYDGAVDTTLAPPGSLLSNHPGLRPTKTVVTIPDTGNRWDAYIFVFKNGYYEFESKKSERFPGEAIARMRFADLRGMAKRIEGANQYGNYMMELTLGGLGVAAAEPSYLVTRSIVARLPTTAPNLAAQNVANPRLIRFTQPTASPNFSTGGHTIQSTMEELVAGKPASSLPTIRVIEHNGQLFTLDNRRLVAFQNAGLKEIPVQRLSMSDPAVAKEFWRKFNPIEGGTKIVITPNADRKAAEALLRQMGKIK